VYTRHEDEPVKPRKRTGTCTSPRSTIVSSRMSIKKRVSVGIPFMFTGRASRSLHPSAMGMLINFAMLKSKLISMDEINLMNLLKAEL
jgi:hypothetical protein